jgi:BASS family bile acid:Na+ symporter
MQESILTSVLLPLALAFIMLGMGLSLTLRDFKNVIVYPKAVLGGLFNQLILLPLTGFLLVSFFGLTGALAVGVIILTACPGGATSNLITHLSRGDIALSITLTAISSTVTVFTIPFIVNLAIGYFGEEGSITLPVLETIIQIFGVTIIPVSIGMVLFKKFPALSQKADRPVRIASAVFFVLIVLAAILKERDSVVAFFKISGPVMLALNLLTLASGFFIARLLRLPAKQRLTIAIESGIQNGTLGILIAATLLKNSEMTIPIAIYSLIMFMTSALLIMGRKKLVGQE